VELRDPPGLRLYPVLEPVRVRLHLGLPALLPVLRVQLRLYLQRAPAQAATLQKQQPLRLRLST
jgi:hypothetical protein